MNASPESPSGHNGPSAQTPRPQRFASWQEHHGWSAAASLRRLATRPLGSLLTIAVMGLALALPLAFYLLLGNVQKLGDAMGQSQAISVFMQTGQSGQATQLLATQLGNRPEVASVAVKSPQQGMEELAKMQGFSGALELLDDNPLPYVVQLQPRTDVSAAAVETLVADVRAMRGVELVQDSDSWRKRLEALLDVGNRVVLMLALMLAAAALLVVGNTVRVDIASRSEEIGVLLLVGASDAFVRRPYLYAGIWYGLFSGIFAAALAVVIELGLAAPVAQLSQTYDGKLQVAGLPTWLLLAVPLAAAALGWLGARLVSAWQLRKAA
ncbi:cell division protein [Rhodanobacter sp. Root627]|uniref:permease-like cell division protein FtsX n=1 Tax=Rhodanobacter sp. Root627 TaxID=1736572 RepID=UPI0006F1C4B2|nr:permease-like cell division protein FtsX [Rhodanobacter sp. Root627]KRA33406.1 cell division protein [Rhodanobacter sp. Root627]